jgi:hypothetical protein
MWRRSTSRLLCQAKSLELGELVISEPKRFFWKAEKEGKDMM